MTALDAGVIIITLVFLIRGIWVGLVRQLASIAALILGFWAAGHFYRQFAGLINSFVPSPQISFLITFALLFLLVYLLVMGLGIGLKKVMSVTLLGWFDKMMGGIFGFSKAALVVTVVFMILSGFLTTSSPLLKKSFFTPYLEQSSRYLSNFIKDEKLRSHLLPQKPAISDFLKLPLPPSKVMPAAIKKKVK